MPLPAAIIPAAIGAATAGANIYAQGKTNRKTRQWNEMMYGRQRADALQDWEMQNAYNSPAAQMQRLREAGLNPNLVYESGATHTASSVRSTESKPWNPQAPDFSQIPRAAAQGIEAYQDYTLQQETVKNMQAQRRNMEIDAALKSVQVSQGLINSDLSKVKLAEAIQLFDTSIATAQANLRAMDVGTDIKVSQEVRAAALHAPTLSKAIQDAANASGTGKLIESQLRNSDIKNQLDRAELELRNNGMSYSDPLVVRMIAKLVTEFSGKSIPDFIKTLSDLIFKEGKVTTEVKTSH